MKQARNLLLCLAGGLALNATARADDAMLAGNPYAPVVARNIFGLNPPAPVNPDAAADATPPPKITPTGITDILGQLEVLFKVATPAKSGKPAKDDDYILSEGQRQDDIEVLKIDEPNGIVTFNNHGQTQELPLVAAAASSPKPAAGGSPAHPPSGFQPPPSSFPRPTGTTFNRQGNDTYGGNYARNNTGMGNNGMNNGINGSGGGLNNSGNANGGLNFGYPSSGTPAYHNAADQIPAGMTPEVQTVTIEVNRQAALQGGDAEAAAMLPITDLTSQNQQ